jgi:hypothetical protein
MKSARGQPHYLPDLQPAIPWFRGFTQSPPVFLRKINFYLAFNLLYQLPGTSFARMKAVLVLENWPPLVGGLSLSGDFSFHSA